MIPAKVWLRIPMYVELSSFLKAMKQATVKGRQASNPSLIIVLYLKPSIISLKYYYFFHLHLESAKATTKERIMRLMIITSSLIFNRKLLVDRSVP